MTRPELVFPAVIEDLKARDAIGKAQHDGRELDALDGRDWLLEAYEEELDKVVYMKAELLRRAAHTAAPVNTERRVQLLPAPVGLQPVTAWEVAALVALSTVVTFIMVAVLR